jgi:hypothetical protein
VHRPFKTAEPAARPSLVLCATVQIDYGPTRPSSQEERFKNIAEKFASPDHIGPTFVADFE